MTGERSRGARTRRGRRRRDTREVARIDERAEPIGREAELEALGERLALGARLMTLTGAAGIGKTTLAQQLAEAEEHGATFVDLTEARGGAGVRGAVARALDVELPESPEEAWATLERVLAARTPMLLVLDNCEHLRADAAETAGRLLRALDGLQILATSREPLRLAREEVWHLEPLDLRGDDGVGGSDAHRLFLREALAARRGRALDEDEARVAAEVVDAVGGNPLVLRLAAGRLGVMEPRALLARVREGIDVLQAHRPHPHSRWRSVEDALAWSWQLLAPPEREALERLAVFRGGFSCAAAEAVLGDLDASPLGLVEALREKSLLEREEGARRLRLRLFLALRHFAERRASPETRERAERRRAEHLEEALPELARQVDGPDAARVRERLADELPNAFAAVDWALGVGERGRALRLLVALFPVVLVRGPYAPYRERLAAALEGDGLERGLRVDGLLAQAHVERATGHRREATDAARRALALAEDAGDEARRARCSHMLGNLFFSVGEHDAAEAAFETALALGERLRDDERVALGSRALATIAMERGRLDEAEPFITRSLVACQRAGLLRHEASARLARGALCLHRGRLREARDQFLRARAAQRSIGSQRDAAVTTANLAITLHLEGALDEATRSYAEAIEALESLGARRGLSLHYHGYLGLALLQSGRFGEARRHLEQARTGVEGLGDRRHGAVYGALLACGFAADEGGGVEARALLAEAAQELDGSDDPLRGLHRACGAFVRQRVGSEAERGEATEEARRLRAEASRPGALVEVRLAVALLDAPAQPEAPGCFVVDARGRWFETPAGEHVDLRTRTAPSRILAALLERHAHEGSRPIGRDRLFDIGWPGQRAIPDAAAHRVYVAISTLRKLGLKDVLLRVDEGYLLDPDREIVPHE